MPGQGVPSPWVIAFLLIIILGMLIVFAWGIAEAIAKGVEWLAKKRRKVNP